MWTAGTQSRPDCSNVTLFHHKPPLQSTTRWGQRTCRSSRLFSSRSLWFFFVVWEILDNFGYEIIVTPIRKSGNCYADGYLPRLLSLVCGEIDRLSREDVCAGIRHGISIYIYIVASRVNSFSYPLHFAASPGSVRRVRQSAFCAPTETSLLLHSFNTQTL